MKSIGIVIKKHQIIIVSLKQSLREICLDGYQILPLGNVKEEEKEDAILQIIDRFMNIHKIDRDNLFLALPREKVLCQLISLPLAVEENLRATLGYEMDRHTPFSADDVYFDYYILRRSPAGNLLYLMLITVKRQVVDHYIDLFKEINIRPRGIELTSSALFNVCQTRGNGSEKIFSSEWIQKGKSITSFYRKFSQFFPEKLRMNNTEESPDQNVVTALIEYTNDHYELDMIYEGALYYSRLFPLRSAEDGQDLTAHFKEIKQEVDRASLQLFDHKNGEKPIQFILSGKQIDEKALEKLGENLEINLSTIESLSITYNEKADRNNLPLLSVAIGLALKGLTRVPLDINLIPSYLRLKKKRSKKKIAALLLAIVLFSVSGVLLVKGVIEKRAYLASIDNQLIELKLKVKSIEEMQREIDEIEKYTSGLKKIKQKDISKLIILEELTKIIPEDSWLTNFSFKGDERKIKISGYSVSASKLIPILEESKLFENVKFTSPITKGRSVKENFRIEMTISSQKNVK